MGGADEVVAKAQKSYGRGDQRWVAEVLGHVLFAEPGHTGARTLQADTFERLGHGSECGPWRTFSLMDAAELRDGILGTPTRSAPDVIATLTAEQVFQSMAVRVNGPRAAQAGRLVLRREFTDTRETWTLRLPRTVRDATAAGTVSLDGDAQALITFSTLPDTPDPAFAMVTP